MVTERATRLRGGTDRDPRGMDGLREAVDALGHYLDALDLLRGAGIAIEAPGHGDRPRRPTAATGSAPPADARPLAAGPRLEPARSLDLEPNADGALSRAADGPPSPDRPPRTADGPPETGGAESSPPFPAFRDQVTGLLSREGFEWIASGELKRCARHGRVFTILLLQIGADDDELVRRASDVLRRVLRGSDVAGREDARALVVALPETAQREARAVAERLIEQLEGSSAWSREGRVGMAGYPTHGETVWSLLETARGKLSLPVGNVLQRGGDGGYWSG